MTKVQLVCLMYGAKGMKSVLQWNKQHSSKRAKLVKAEGGYGNKATWSQENETTRQSSKHFRRPCLVAWIRSDKFPALFEKKNVKNRDWNAPNFIQLISALLRHVASIVIWRQVKKLWTSKLQFNLFSRWHCRGNLPDCFEEQFVLSCQEWHTDKKDRKGFVREYMYSQTFCVLNWFTILKKSFWIIPPFLLQF